MIASCELKPAPRRLVLGSDAYQHIEASLVERLCTFTFAKGARFLDGSEFVTILCMRSAAWGRKSARGRISFRSKLLVIS
jgi:hypothetical protein